MVATYNFGSVYSFLYIQTLHNDCSHIEDVHLLFCAHFINFVSFLTGVVMDATMASKFLSLKRT